MSGCHKPIDVVAMHTNMINELQKKVNDLERYKSLINFLDKARGEDRREFINLECKVEELEKENKMRQDTIACIDRAYDEECEKLKKRIKELEKQIIEMRGLSLHRTNPHKCPVCDGNKTVITGFKFIHPMERLSPKYNMNEVGETIMDCEACEGKGIVWG